MAIYYTVGQRVDPKKPEATPKYYASAKSIREETIRDIAIEISKRNNMSVGDVYASIEALLDLVPELLAKGSIVRLGEFGNFRMTISSKGSDTSEAYSAALIKEAYVRFFPGRIFKKTIDTLEFKRYLKNE